MAHVLALGQADVEGAGIDEKQVSVSTRHGVLVLRRDGVVVAEREGVTRVRQLGRRRWAVEFGVDGGRVVIEQECGCGGPKRRA